MPEMPPPITRALLSTDMVGWGSGWIFGLYFAFGGLAFSIYPMSVAHMLDTLSLGLLRGFLLGQIRLVARPRAGG